MMSVMLAPWRNRALGFLFFSGRPLHAPPDGRGAAGCARHPGITRTDSSALVKRYVEEEESPAVAAKIAGAAIVGTSLITRIEVPEPP